MIAASVAATAAQQHVCLDEEEEEVSRRTPLDKGQHVNEDHSKFSSKEVNQTGCQAASTDGQKEEEKKKEAIIITTNNSSSTHTEAEGTHGGPDYYLEVRRKNAELRSSWFQQPTPTLPKQQQQLNIWPGPPNMTNSSTVGEKSSVAPGLEEAEELCVVATTLGQGFETRTRSFYSICPIEADDLDHEQTSGASLSTSTAEVSRQAKDDNPAPELSTGGLVPFELSNEAPPQPERLVSDLLPLPVGQNDSQEPQVISQKHPYMSAVAGGGAASVNVVPSEDLFSGEQVNHVDTYFDCLHQSRAAFQQVAAHTPAVDTHCAASQPDVDLQSGGQVEVVSTAPSSEQEELLSDALHSPGSHTDSQQPQVASQELPENEHSQVSSDSPNASKQQYLVMSHTQQDQSSSGGPSSYKQCVEADFNYLYESRESSEPHAVQISPMTFPSSPPSLPPSPPPSPASTEPVQSDIDQTTTVEELLSLSGGHVEVMPAEKQGSKLSPQPEDLLGQHSLSSGGQSEDEKPPLSCEEPLVTSQEPPVAFKEPRACEHVQVSSHNSMCTHTESECQSPEMSQTEETGEQGAKDRLVDQSEESGFDCLHQSEPFAQQAVPQGPQEAIQVEHGQAEECERFVPSEDESGSLHRSRSFPTDPDADSAPALLDGDQMSTELCEGQVEPVAAEESFKPSPHPEDLLKGLSPMSGDQINEQTKVTNQENSQETLHRSNDSECQSPREDGAAEEPDGPEGRPRRTKEELLAQVLEADLESKPNAQPTEVQTCGPEMSPAALIHHDFNPTPSEQELYSSPSDGKVEEVESSCLSQCADHSVTSDTSLTEVSSVYSTSTEWPPAGVYITPDDTLERPTSGVSLCSPQGADLHPEFTEQELCQAQQPHLHTSDLDTECGGTVDLKNSSSSSQFQGGDPHLEMTSEICVQAVAVEHLGQDPLDPPTDHQCQPPPRPCEDSEQIVGPESNESERGPAGEPKENSPDVCNAPVENKLLEWTENQQPATNYFPDTASPSERHLLPICLHPHRESNGVGSDQVEVDHQTGSSCSPLLLDLPDGSICPNEEVLVLGCCMETDLPVTDLCQVDAHASTPSYQIHSACQDPLAAAADEGGIREMVSELLGEEADSSPCRRHPQPWIRLGLEGSGVGWAQGTSQGQDDGGRRSSSECEVDGDLEQIPGLVTELQPSMALLGAYPYSTVLPQGACVWEWHTQQPQHVSHPPQSHPLTEKKSMLMR